MREPGEHNETIDFCDLEIEHNKFIDIKVNANYTITNCECTSMHGEQSVSESWQEIELDDWDIEEIRFIKSHDYPMSYAHKQKIEGEINEYINDTY